MEITIRVIALCIIEPREDDLLNLIRILRVCMGKSRSSTNFRRRRRLITKTVRFNYIRSSRRPVPGEKQP